MISILMRSHLLQVATTALFAWALTQRLGWHDSFALYISILLFVQQLLRLGWQVAIYPHFLSPLRNIPEPKGGTFFNGHQRILSQEPKPLALRRWINEVPNDGFIRYRQFWNDERLVPTSAQAVDDVLRTNYRSFVKPKRMRYFLTPVTGNGPLVTEGEEHKNQRKSISPAFSYRNIKALFPAFWAHSKDVVGALRSQISNSLDNELEVTAFMSRSTLDILGEAGLGQKFNASTDPDSGLNKHYRKIFEPSTAHVQLVILTKLFPYWFISLLPLKRNRALMAAREVARNTCRQLIRQKKRNLAQGNDSDRDIIATAIRSKVELTDDGLVDVMMSILAAGHETTAVSLQWAVHLLSEHPNAQIRLRQEIHDQTAALKNSDMCGSTLENMPYLNAVCSEVLRLYPAGATTIREAVHDTKILDQFVPKGTKITIAPAAVNCSFELWGTDALEFKPERWLGEGRARSGGATASCAFLTFLHGPHDCLGESFARGVFRSMLAAFVGSFEFEKVQPGEQAVMKGFIFLKPMGGMRVRLKVLDWLLFTAPSG